MMSPHMCTWNRKPKRTTETSRGWWAFLSRVWGGWAPRGSNSRPPGFHSLEVSGFMVLAQGAVQGSLEDSGFMAMVQGILRLSNNLQKCLRIMACLVWASVDGSRASIEEPVTINHMTKARCIIDLVWVLEVTPAVTTRLVSLAPFIKAG